MNAWICGKRQLINLALIEITQKHSFFQTLNSDFSNFVLTLGYSNGVQTLGKLVAVGGFCCMGSRL